MAAQSWRARSGEPLRVAFVATDGGLTGDGASADSGMMNWRLGRFHRGAHRLLSQKRTRGARSIRSSTQLARFLIVVGVRCRAVAALEVLLDGLCNGRYFYADDDFARRSDAWIVVAA
jgi:hypothetical protein